MKRNARNISVLAIVTLTCIILSLCIYFAGGGVAPAAPMRVKEISGVSVNAVSVFDVKGVMKMSAINYLPDDFAELNETVSNENTGGSPVRRGTYRFCIDTLQGDEWNDTDDLQGLLSPDGNWHLTMYIPPVFSACSIYVQYQNKAYIGSIDRYNVNYYLSFSAPSEFDDTVLHNTSTQPVFIDIPVSSNHKYSKECNVTIHYEADNDNFIGLSDGILIGEDSAIRRTVENNRMLLLIGAIVGSATFLLFLFVCILKRSLAFVPQLLFAAGIFFSLFSAYALFGLTAVPYFALAVQNFSGGLIVVAATLYLPEKSGKIPVLVPVICVAIAAQASAFISPFVLTVSAHAALRAVSLVLYFVCLTVALIFNVYDVVKGKPAGLRLNCVIAVLLTITTAFFGKPLPFISLDASFWLKIYMLAIIVVIGFREFISAERHNRYLTANLQKEVAKETQNLQAVLAERDKILLYVSHDMKKTVVGMGNSLTDLKQRLTDAEFVLKVDYLLQKNAELKQNFAEIGKYGKRNYVAEKSEVLDLNVIIRKVTDDLRPDCEANGIALSVSLPDKTDVYAKKVALESVLLNLILNAIEHAECSRIFVAITKRKDECRINIVDDGKGISTDKNVFEPFVSGDSSENNSGLGLFLAKSAIESMHGSLTYERKDNLTVFSATLPLA